MIADTGSGNNLEAVIMTEFHPKTEALRFAIGDFSLGKVLVAVSGRGVSAILMGDTDEALRLELERSFPRVTLTGEAAALADTLAAVIAFLETPRAGLDLPLDIKGSPFEKAVWQALRDVPPGETISYGHVAKALPMVATAQEVGAACAANRLAVAIPCHRVVKSDGGISGYRWGVARKRRLINREAAQ
jgi:AraC family transcriptional regulator of adaptative response/methylated-DNA-[protein]-cysteine methyltransferase